MVTLYVCEKITTAIKEMAATPIKMAMFPLGVVEF